MPGKWKMNNWITKLMGYTEANDRLPMDCCAHVAS